MDYLEYNCASDCNQSESPQEQTQTTGSNSDHSTNPACNQKMYLAKKVINKRTTEKPTKKREAKAESKNQKKADKSIRSVQELKKKLLKEFRNNFTESFRHRYPPSLKLSPDEWMAKVTFFFDIKGLSEEVVA